MQGINDMIVIKAFETNINPENAEGIASDFDILVDCSDNAVTKYLINDVAVLQQKPFVWGAAVEWQGQVSVFSYSEDSPCYRCIFPKCPAPSQVTFHHSRVF